MEKIKILSQQEINKELEDLPGWEQQDDKIVKQIEFKDFISAINFVYQLAPSFERIEHHPDIHIFYNKILFELQRFDIGGKITNKDIEAAHEIEKNTVEWEVRERNMKKWKTK